MRGHWWGLVVLLAATTLAVSAKPTAKAGSTSDSVTIPLILRQPGDAKPAEPKKKTPPPKTEPKSPQDILAESTPVAMQTAEPPVEVPSLEPPPAPVLEPAFPTNPELFVPDLTTPLPPPKLQIAEPKPQPKKLTPAATPQPTPVVAEPKKLIPVPLTAPEPKAQPARVAEPKFPTPMPREKPRAATMEPVDDVKPSGLRKAREANPPALAPQDQHEAPAAPRAVEMQPVEDIKSGTLRAGADGKPPSFRCLVRDVTAFSDRTHVRCHNKVQGVGTFAVNTDQPVAETVVTKALAAMKSGKPITIAFAPDVDLNPPNCGGNCRRLIDIEN
ncbi:MAG: hypothetical protein ACKVRO_08130 [Micropepsaceae bacterium]